MAERQAHGLQLEELVKQRYGLLPYLGKQEYTANYDAETPDGTPVSIKTKKNKTDVELGDYFRNAEAKEDFYLVVGYWEGRKNNIVDEYHLLIPVDVWRSFFDTTMHDRIRQVIREASNDRSYDPIWRERITGLKADYNSPVIRLRPKRDHKKQKRMQCAISYKDLLTLNEKYGTNDLREIATNGK